MGSPLRLHRLDRGPDDLPVHIVSNGDVELAFLPTVGGRLVSVCCAGAELLWRNPEYLDRELRTVRPRSTWRLLDGSMGSWANVGGSKTWPAPQGWSGPREWAGPPDPVLDSGTWSIASAWSPADNELTVTSTSPDDPRSGLRIVRELALPATGTSFRQRNTFTNVSAAAITWSVWEVCQVDTTQFVDQVADVNGPGIRVGVTGDAAPLSMVEAVGAIDVGPPVAGVRFVPVSPVVAKVGFVDASGFLELRRPDGARVTWHIEVPQGVYPDGGCQVELWMQCPTEAPLPALGDLHPSAHLVELEVLSPLTAIAPGESLTTTIGWEVCGPG